MKKHKQWVNFIAYFKDIPINNLLITHIEFILKTDNVLIMIKKEDPESNPKYTQEEKHEELRKIFNDDIISNKLILSIVPDIKHTVEYYVR